MAARRDIHARSRFACGPARVCRGLLVAALACLLAPATAPASTNLSLAACPAASTSVDFGMLLPGTPRRTDPCTIQFGSSDGTALLSMAQADGGGQAMVAAPRSGVVGYWPFNADLADRGSGASTAVRPAAPNDPSFVTGKAGNGYGLNFDGDDSLQVPHVAAHDLGVFTVEAWAKTSSIANTAFPTLVSKSVGPGSRNFWLHFDRGANLVNATISVGGVDTSTAGTSATPYLDGSWHHYAMVADGSTLHLYVDGVERASAAYAGTVDKPAVPISVGVDGANYFQGAIDEVRLSSVARSAGDIYSAYRNAMADYSATSNNWAGSTALFGVCLQGVAGAGVSATWTPDGNADCTTVDSDPWRAVGTGFGSVSGAGSKVAESTTTGTTTDTATIRFGARPAASTPPGSYAASISVDVVSPNLFPPSNTVAPSIAGTAQQRSTLTANPGTWSGSEPLALTYQWRRCDGAGNNCVDVDGATASTYLVTSSDVASTLRVAVGATNTEGSLAVTSVPTAAVVAAQASLVYLTGFEHGTVSAAGGGVVGSVLNAPALSADPVVKRNGSRSLFVNDTGTGGSVSLPMAASPVGVARVAVLLDALPSGTKDAVGFLTSAGETPDVGFDSDGTIYAYACGVRASGGLKVAAGQWTLVEMRLDTSQSPWTFAWRVNGQDMPGLRCTAPAANVTSVYLGSGGGGSTRPMHVDDVAVSASAADYPLGDGKVLGFVPNATLTHTNPAEFDRSADNAGSWATLTADSNLAPGSSQYVDDWPVTVGAAADLVRQTGTTGTLDYALTNTTETAPPTGVRIVGAHREAATGANTVKVGASLGPVASAYTADPVDGSGTVDYFGGMVARPGGGTWSAADISALRITLSSTAATPNVWTDALMAEADFPVQPAPPVNIQVPSVTPTTALAVGDRLAGNPGSWSGRASIATAFRWLRCNAAGGACAAIGGATGRYYVAATADMGSTLRLEVTASNADGSAIATSVQSSVVAAASTTAASPVNIAPVGVLGAAREDRRLSASTGEWTDDPTSYAFQWNRCSSYAGAVMQADPVGYWRLDDPFATTAHDSTGYAHDGAYVASVVTGAQGALATDTDQAATFAHGSDTVTVNSLGVNTAGGAANTVEFWMKWDGVSGSIPFGFDNYTLYFSGGSFGFNSVNGDVYGIAPAQTAGLANRWVHVVAVFRNGSPATSTLYLDGVQQTLSQVIGVPNAVNAQATATGHISGYGVAGAATFGGQLDDVSVFPRALTAAEAQGHFAASRQTTCAPIAGATAATYDTTGADVDSALTLSVTAANASGSTTATSARGASVVAAPPRSDYSKAVLQDAPVAYWRLGEASGAAATDETRYLNQGTYGAGVTLAQTSAVANDANTAATFSGAANSMVDAAVPQLVSTAGAFTTAEFWMYWNGTDNQIPFGFSSYDLYFAGGSFGFNTNNGGDVYGISSAGLANRWVHVVAMFDSGDVTQNKLYLDGAPQTLTQRIGSPVSASVTSPVRLGGWPPNAASRFAGRLDEVSLYNGQLTAARVTAHFQAGTAARTKPTIAGTAAAGQTLTATATGSWTSSRAPRYTYQWQRCTGVVCVDVPGATATTYLLASGDVGTTVRAHVFATTSGGTDSAYSDVTATVTGTVTLTFNASTTWSPPAGVTSATFTAVGGGGNGAAAANGGGGGGGGAFSLASSIALDPAATYTVTVGNGGAPGADSSISATATAPSINLSAGGGGAGTAGDATCSTPAGGAPGAGSTHNGGTGGTGAGCGSSAYLAGGAGAGSAGTATNGNNGGAGGNCGSPGCGSNNQTASVAGGGFGGAGGGNAGTGVNAGQPGGAPGGGGGGAGGGDGTQAGGVGTGSPGKVVVDCGGCATQTYAVAGSYSYTVPAGVSSVTIQLWGGGGGGGSACVAVGGLGCSSGGTWGSSGAGGGGGGYTTATVAVTQGEVLTVTVGSGGTANVAGGASTVTGGGGPVTATFVLAKGGAGAAAGAGGAGGSSAAGIGSTLFSGGLGANGAGIAGGGGGGAGSSAGTAAIGNAGTGGSGASGGAGGPAPAGGFAGGGGGNNAVAGSPGTGAGAGGGGGGGGAGGGAGSKGIVTITYTV